MRIGPIGSWFTAALALGGLAGCGEDGTTVSPETNVRVVLTVNAAAGTGRIDLLPHYLRANRTRVDFTPTTVPLATGGQQVPLDLDITDCLRDPVREAVGVGCPLRLAAVLRSDQGATVDSQLVGPFDLVPGGTATTPTITLRAFGSVVLTPARDTINPGGTLAIGLRVLDRQGGDLGVRSALWTTSAAPVATVSTTGVVTGVAPGTATITATLAADTTVTGTATIAVRGIVSFAITADSVVLPVQDSVMPATTIAAVGVSNAVRWLSRANAIATVDASRGVITAVSPGRTVIVAQPIADPTKTDSIVVVVAGVVSVAVAPRTAVLPVAGTTQLAATVVTTGGVSGAVSYQSSAPAIANVSGGGLVTAVATGTAVVRVISTADPTKRDSAVVRVFPQTGNTTCAPATFLADTIRVATRLDKARSPYRVPVNLVVTQGAVLTVDPGVTICVDPTMALTVEQGAGLVARGATTDSIRFTATDPALRWEGFRFAGQPVTDSSVITNAVLEHGRLLPLTIWTSAHPVVYDGVRFRQWAGSALQLGRGRVSRSVIDTVVGGEAAVYLGPGTTFEATTVRQADSIGVYAADDVRLLGGRIERAGVGLVNLAGSRPPAAYQAIRLTANRGVPARLEPKWVARIAADSLTQASYLGNAIDAIATAGSLTADTIRVFGHLGLMVTGLVVGDRGLLVARPGARIEMIPDSNLDTNGFITFFDGGRLDARGSFARPVVFTPRNPAIPFDAISFFGTQSGAPLAVPPGDTTRLVNVIVQFGGGAGAALNVSTAGLPVIIDSTRVRQGPGTGIQVAFIRGPSFLIDTATVERTVRIVRSRVDTTGHAFAPAVMLLASSIMRQSVVRGALGTGILLAEGNVDSVTVTESRGHGVEIGAVQNVVGPLTIQRSNLVNNTGFGINHEFPSVDILAPDIWWGDPQGPFGTFGDGVGGVGFVDFAPPAVAPVGLATPFPVPPGPTAAVTRPKP